MRKSESVRIVAGIVGVCIGIVLIILGAAVIKDENARLSVGNIGIVVFLASLVVLLLFKRTVPNSQVDTPVTTLSTTPESSDVTEPATQPSGSLTIRNEDAPGTLSLPGNRIKIVISVVLYILAFAWCLDTLYLLPSQWMIKPIYDSIQAQLTQAKLADTAMRSSGVFQTQEMHSAFIAMSKIDLSAIASSACHQVTVSFYTNLLVCVILFVGAMFVVPRRYWRKSSGVVLSTVPLILVVIVIITTTIHTNIQNAPIDVKEFTLSRYPQMLSPWPKIVDREDIQAFEMLNFQDVYDAVHYDDNNREKVDSSLLVYLSESAMRSHEPKSTFPSTGLLVDIKAAPMLLNANREGIMSLVWDKSIEVIHDKLNSHIIISEILVSPMPPIIFSLLALGFFFGLWLIDPSSFTLRKK